MASQEDSMGDAPIDIPVEEPTTFQKAYDEFSAAEPPDPNTFLKQAWPHLATHQQDLFRALLTAPQSPDAQERNSSSQMPEPNGPVAGPPAGSELDTTTSPLAPIRVGLETGQGGLARKEDTNFSSSNELMDQVLPTMPAVFGQFKNQKIDRPADLSWIYGQKPGSQSAGGYYQQGADFTDNETGVRTVNPPTVAIGRGDEEAPGGGKQFALDGTRHELIHAFDFQNGSPTSESQEFRAMVKKNLAGLSNLVGAYGPTGAVLARGEMDHVFTNLAEVYMKSPATLPPGARTYFDSLFADRRRGSNTTAK